MAIAAENGYDAVVVVPIGFAIDHMETLWDLDIEAMEQAEELGLRFTRTPVPNDDRRFIEALSWAVEPLLSVGNDPD
jgi:ferrochelatase